MTVKIVDIVRTCTAWPSQWEGKLSDGRMFCARFHHSNFSLSLSVKPTDDVIECLDNPEQALQCYIVDGNDGFMTDLEFLNLLVENKIVMSTFLFKLTLKTLLVYEMLRNNITRRLPLHKVFSDQFCRKHIYFWYMPVFDRGRSHND